MLIETNTLYVLYYVCYLELCHEVITLSIFINICIALLNLSTLPQYAEVSCIQEFIYANKL